MAQGHATSRVRAGDGTTIEFDGDGDVDEVFEQFEEDTPDEVEALAEREDGTDTPPAAAEAFEDFLPEGSAVTDGGGEAGEEPSVGVDVDELFAED